MFLLSIKNLKELQYDDGFLLPYCSVEHLNVKSNIKTSFIIRVAIAETLRLFLKENTVTVMEIQILFSPCFFNRQNEVTHGHLFLITQEVIIVTDQSERTLVFKNPA